MHIKKKKKIAETHTHREKLLQQNKPPKQTSRNNSTSPTETKSHLPFIAEEVVLSSLLSGWGPLGGPRLLRSLCPLERHKQPVPRGSPRPCHKRLSGKAPQDPPVPSAVPGTKFGSPNPASAPQARGEPSFSSSALAALECLVLLGFFVGGSCPLRV